MSAGSLQQRGPFCGINIAADVAKYSIIANLNLYSKMPYEILVALSH
jgi:hypothetical protein